MFNPLRHPERCLQRRNVVLMQKPELRYKPSSMVILMN
ncbi:MAG: hypothetical protein ACFNQE_06915 [Capnocytophaga leadbetteri]